ncbi:complement C1q-like protein 2 [Mytilus edulis]|uniref:complement C1q-like protein 2 n=1 Tax=Mytilus edulis TaxID=6550 RepID=UPI0039F0C9F7
MTNVKHLEQEKTRLNFVQSVNTNDLQIAPKLEQAHKECGGVKHVSVVTELCSKEIQVLRNENQILRRIVTKFVDELTEHKNALDELIVFKKSFENYTTANENERRMHAKRAADSVIAFHVYASSDMYSLGVHQTIQFDTEVTNEGNGYNKFTGTFIVPSSGFYVFTWTIDVLGTLCQTELAVNGIVIGLSYPDSLQNENNAISTTVVKQVSTGDAVAVRARGCQRLRSDTAARCSFSGWKL